MLNSSAWLSLTPPAVVVYLALAKRYNGHNNGRIGLSQRDAARECHISRATVARAFEELQQKGFVELAKPGSFHQKVSHSTEWRLTILKCDCTGELPTKRFMSWRPGKIQNAGLIGALSGSV